MTSLSSTMRRSKGFVEYGKGTRVAPEEPWEQRVMEDAILWDEYGLPLDPRQLPRREYEAHLAIVRGKQEHRERERKKAEREASTTHN